LAIWEKIKGFFGRDRPINAWRYSGYPFLFGYSNSGKAVNETTAMQVTGVYACVRVIAESIAQLPLHVYRRQGGGVEKAPGHYLYQLLHDAPNNEMTSFTWRETGMAHICLQGNHYSQILHDRRGRVLGLYPLLPAKMQVKRDDNGVLYYEYTPTTQEADGKFTKTEPVKLRREDVLHIKGLGFDGLIGYSPIAVARNAIGLAIATEEYGSKFFRNSARPIGILTTEQTLKNPDKMREAWEANYGGTDNIGKTAVLEQGMKYQAIGIPPEDAQFLETRKYQLNEIARIFRIPPHMIGDLEKATFSNIEHQSLEFVKYTLSPWVERWEQELNKALLTDSERGEYFIKFNVDGLLRGDYKSRMEGYSVAIQNGIMSINEAREKENMNPLSDEEGGNLHLINGNMTKLKDAGIFAGTETSASESDKSK